jgi:hypothetical protein
MPTRLHRSADQHRRVCRKPVCRGEVRLERKGQLELAQGSLGLAGLKRIDAGPQSLGESTGGWSGR